MSFQHGKEFSETDFKVIESRRVDVRLPVDFGEVNCTLSTVAAAVNTLWNLEEGKQITVRQIVRIFEEAGAKNYHPFTSALGLSTLLRLIKMKFGFEIKRQWLFAHPDFGQHLFGVIKREIDAGRLVQIGILTPRFWLKEVRGVAGYKEDWMAGHSILINGYSVLSVPRGKEFIVEVCDPYDKRAIVVSSRLVDLQESLVDGTLVDCAFNTIVPLPGIFTLYRD